MLRRNKRMLREVEIIVREFIGDIELRDNENIYEFYGLDVLDLIEIITKVEDQTGIELDNSVLEKDHIKTFSDLNEAFELAS